MVNNVAALNVGMCVIDNLVSRALVRDGGDDVSFPFTQQGRSCDYCHCTQNTNQPGLQCPHRHIPFTRTLSLRGRQRPVVVVRIRAIIFRPAVFAFFIDFRFPCVRQHLNGPACVRARDRCSCGGRGSNSSAIECGVNGRLSAE